MVNAIPAVQINTVGPSNPRENIIAYAGGVAMLCQTGTDAQVVTLAANSDEVPLPFPVGVTTATFVFVAALTATDLVVNVGDDAFPLPVPLRQGMVLYGLASSDISISSALGGDVQFAVGG